LEVKKAQELGLRGILKVKVKTLEVEEEKKDDSFDLPQE